MLLQLVTQKIKEVVCSEFSESEEDNKQRIIQMFIEEAKSQAVQQVLHQEYALVNIKELMLNLTDIDIQNDFLTTYTTKKRSSFEIIVPKLEQLLQQVWHLRYY